MFREAHSVPDRATVDTDICVVGGGAAGITMALEWAQSALDVVLLESGGFVEEADTQDLYRGQTVGVPYYELHDTRFRLLGGSTNRWAGWCRPLDEIDFEDRPWVEWSGWPISRGDLDPWYVRAAQLCELPTASFELDRWADSVPGLYRQQLFGDKVRTLVWQGSPPTKFGRIYRDDLERAKKLTVFLHANVVEIEVNEGASKATGVLVRRLSGGGFRVRARVVVLAAGGIETVRLLLSSDRVENAGLGNRNGLVGRFFMEHPHVITGRVILDRRPGSRPVIQSLDRGIGGSRERLALRRPSGGVKCAFGIPEHSHEQAELLNYSAALVPTWRTRVEYAISDLDTYRSLRLLMENLRSAGSVIRQIRERRLPEGVGDHIIRVVTHPQEIVRVLYREMLRRPSVVEVMAQTEQAPNPHSRVYLGEERDALGMRRVIVDWRLLPVDKHSIIRAQGVLGHETEAAGLGRMEHSPWLLEDDYSWPEDLTGGHHHMGTTRMSDDPKRGVVDQWGRVHGIANLFISGASVFPTGGFANPLLTLVALAARQADHIRRRWPDVA